MSAEPPEGPGTLPLGLVERIDRVCDRFEAALAAGRRPRIEEYLGEIAEPGRSALLRELLATELEWRRHRGERPTPGEYRDRFPSAITLIEATFEEQASGGDRSSRGPRPSGHRGADRGTSGRTTRIAGGEDRGDDAPRPGARPLPGYRLIGRLGRGGFGEVWKAEAPGGVPVALKFVRLRDGHATVERRALEILKGIRHPNLLAQFGAWQAGDLLIIGMELADGTLQDRFHRAQAEGRVGIPGAELIEYLAEAAKGIDHLNDHIHALDGRVRVGVQHRDIKPQNILLAGGGVKVADFGLARLLDRSVTGHTGSLTPAYAAPEFFRNETSDRSDQYSLAVTYCHMRGGRLPFAGGPAAVMTGHVHHPPDLTMLPESERPVVARALDKDPAGRWPDCRAFVAALRASLAADGPPATKGIAPREGPVGPIPERPPPRRAHRGRRILAGILLVTTSGIGLAVWGSGLVRVVPSRSGPTPSPLQAPRGTPGGGPAGAGSIPSEPDPPDPARSQAAPPIVPESGPLLVGPGTVRPGPRAAAPHMEQGDRHYADGEFEAAVVAYSEAIALDPTDPVAFNNRGNAYLKLGHHGAAIEDYDRAIQLDPGASASHFNRGNAHLGMDQYERAIRDYTEAIRLNPSDPNAYMNRATAHDKLGDRVRSQADRAEAARLEPGSDVTPPG